VTGNEPPRTGGDASGGPTQGGDDASGDRPTWAAFVAMIREEWRLHATLFGGRRFAGMPLLIAALTAAGGWLFQLVGTPQTTILAGAHALVFVFGMHVGTIGLVGHDSLESLLGEVTLLLSSSRTLPLSPRRLLGVFLLKDIVYYAVMVLAPAFAGLAIGTTVGADLTAGAGFGDATVPAATATADVGPAVVGVGPVQAALAFLTATATLALGFAVVFTGIALRTRRRTGNAVLLAAIAAAVTGWWMGAVDVVAYTPYALLELPAEDLTAFLSGLVRMLGPTVLLVAAGVSLYDPTYQSPTRTRTASFDRWRRRLRDADGLVTRTLFDVARSGGGLVKVPFSAGIVGLVAVGTVEFVGVLTGRPPAVGVTLGALLGLTAFTTYNWLTQFDDPGSYLIYPVGVDAVLTAKYRAFLVLGPPVGLGAYALAAVWYRPPAIDLLAGGALLVGLQGYLFGVTVYLAGLRPAELLFDTVLFAGFTLAVATALVPVLVVGLAFGGLTDPTVGGALVAVSAVLGVVGIALARLARGRWTRRYRTEG
jgi:hypothetical protein